MQHADLVLVATPVGQMGRVFDAIAPVLPAQAIVSDAGSTKGDVAALMRQHLPKHLGYCVPAHPIAGSDRSGAVAAQYGLFEQRRVVLTPLADTQPDDATLVRLAAHALSEATQAALYTTREAIQLHGGVGFTWEYDPHLYFRRAQASSQRLAPTHWWLEQVAQQLLDA